MKNIFKKLFVLILIAVSFTVCDKVALSADTTELIITVNRDFSGEVTDELKNLGIVSLEKVFDADNTVMYVAKIKNASLEVISKLKSLPNIIDVENNQEISIYDKSTDISNEFILSAKPNFTGEITDELKALGIVSLEKITDTDEGVMYFAKTKNPSKDFISQISKIDGINYAEQNQVVSSDTKKDDTPSKLSSYSNWFVVGIPVIAVTSIVIIAKKNRLR